MTEGQKLRNKRAFQCPQAGWEMAQHHGAVAYHEFQPGRLFTVARVFDDGSAYLRAVGLADLLGPFAAADVAELWEIEA